MADWQERFTAFRHHRCQLPLPALLNSIRLSRRHAPNHPHPLPIVASALSNIYRKDGSELGLGGQLFLGWSSDRAPGDWRAGIPTDARATIGLGLHARMRTDDWAMLSPGVQVTVHEDASIHLGANVFMNFDVRVLCNESIEIGAYTAIGWETLIMDSNAHNLWVQGQPRPLTAPIVIGNAVWIGARSTILKGVTIGDGAVIAAASVVVSDIPSRCLAAGNPARVVREEVDWQ
jgi:acetyltransferase-like isoleucine patch superfamily enzyme